jgi:hypothetical protein
VISPEATNTAELLSTVFTGGSLVIRHVSN